MARTLKSDLAALRGRIARLGGGALSRSWPWLRHGVNRLVELWSRSLLLRTVASTAVGDHRKANG